MRRALIIAALLLSGCGGSGGGSGGAPPAPHPPPAPPGWSQIFAADFSQLSIGLTAFCTEAVPPAITGSGAFCTFERPGSEGIGALDPGPNAYYRTENGALHVHAESPGFPIIGMETFPIGEGLSFRARIAGSPTSTEAWGGLVVYNGEGNWYAVYCSVLGWGAWSVTTRTDFGVPCNEMADVEIEAANGLLIYRINGVARFQEPGVLQNPPHIALFMGEIDLVVAGMGVWKR